MLLSFSASTPDVLNNHIQRCETDCEAVDCSSGLSMAFIY
jgi:hypothetical protein